MLFRSETGASGVGPGQIKSSTFRFGLTLSSGSHRIATVPHEGSLWVRGGCGRQADGTAGLSPSSRNTRRVLALTLRVRLGISSLEHDESALPRSVQRGVQQARYLSLANESRNAVTNARGSPLPSENTGLARSVQASRISVNSRSGILNNSDENASSRDSL